MAGLGARRYPADVSRPERPGRVCVPGDPVHPPDDRRRRHRSEPLNRGDHPTARPRARRPAPPLLPPHQPGPAGCRRRHAATHCPVQAGQQPRLAPNPPPRPRQPMSPHAPTRHHAAYRVLLMLYPRAFRREYASDMEQLFRDQLAEARQRPGRAPVIRLWARTIADLATSVPPLAMEATVTATTLTSKTACMVLALGLLAATLTGAVLLPVIVGMLAGSLSGIDRLRRARPGATP